MFQRSLARVLGGALRPLVPLSYGKLGYQARSIGFPEDDLRVDMRGQTCLITGANSGIGFATSEALAQRGATVWMLCRSAERGKDAQQKLRERTGNDDIHLAIVDMSERDSIEAFVQKHPLNRVDRLVHSAAILPETYGENSEGIERTLATNLLGPHLLTKRLLPALEASPESRVIHIASGGMYTQKLDIDVLWSAPRPFNGAVQYAQTKRAMSINNELWPQHTAPHVTFHCMHPGWADTPAVRSSLPTFYKLTKPLLRTPEEGADTVLWLAIAHAPAQHNSAFWFDRQREGTHAFPWTKETTNQRDQLWLQCEQWCQETPPLHMP